MTVRTDHWNAVYRTKSPTALSWYQPHLDKSLGYILSSPLGRNSHVIDVGGGASTLVDDLLNEGFQHVTVLDISHRALEQAKQRLGKRAEQVTWVEGDVTEFVLPRQAYDVWHDRAVFHFLVEKEDREKYVEELRRAVRPGAQVIMATFALNGPPMCSGLDVVRYDCKSLLQQLGAEYALAEEAIEAHRTPAGATQQFSYCRFRRSG